MSGLVSYVPPANITQLRSLAEQGELITLDGEIISVSDASNDDLVAWGLVAQHLRDLARMISTSVEPELGVRIHSLAGPIITEYGTAKESISRASVSGIASQRIREIMERCAADGAIPWEAVDNIAPLQAHVTPAKIQNYIETCPAGLADELEPHLPEKRRSIKLEQTAV
jgi:hypothetical protein